MEYKTEKDLTLKQNKVVYEEVYMDCDMSADKYIEGTGWNLKYPSQFSINHSKDKSIAPRRTLLEPKEYHIYMKIAYLYRNDAGNPIVSFTGITDRLAVSLTKDVTMSAFALGFSNEFSLVDADDAINGGRDPQNGSFKLLISYNKTTGAITFYPFYKAAGGNVLEPCFFCFLFYDNVSKSWFKEFLNQKSTQEFNNMCKLDNEIDDPFNPAYYVPEITFHNVWNRDQLCLHASFSNSQKHYLCFSNEFWERPSKIYFDNTYGSEFTVYYTTDGTHKIFPLYAHKLIELSFVLRTSTL